MMEVKSPKQLYSKLFLIYTVILVFVTATLVLYFLSSTKKRYLEQNLEYTKMMSREAEDYLEETSHIAANIHEDLYQSGMELEDLLHYLSDDAETYWKYRLDTYMKNPLGEYEGIESFVAKCFTYYEEVKRITLLSYEKGESTEYVKKGSYRKKGTKLIERIERGNLASEGEFSFLKEIREPVTMRMIGYMLITFDGKQFAKIQQYYSRAELLVYNEAGTIVFDSAKSQEANDILLKEKQKDLEKELKAYVETGQIGAYRIVSYLEKRKATLVPTSSKVMILLFGIMVVIIGEVCVQYYLKRLSARLNQILDGMTQVMEGDLEIRLPINKKNGDELDMISRHFNEMCEKLDNHIKKQYLAEIEQKNAEMAALQSQINPHFLYNTLEVIRMKAICNGDREVGKMLYSMAVTFRSQIKEADIITMAQELHYCKKYMELFEFRYQDQFHFFVECPEKYMKVPIIKFVLQPIIENYFIHGIRMEAKDNFIRIFVEKEGESFKITVEDNGYGMEEHEIQRKNWELMAGVMKKQSSIGVANVNRRLKAVYGKEYGVRIEGRPEGGLRVILRFKPEKNITEDEEMEE